MKNEEKKRELLVDDVVVIRDEILNMTHEERLAEIERLKKELLGDAYKNKINE